MLLALFAPWMPALTILLAASIQEMALPWQAWTFFRPDLVVITLFYWRLFRPDLCGFGLAFAIGLAMDALAGGVLGLNALTKIILLLLVDRFGQQLRTVDFMLLPLAVILLLILESALHLALLTLLTDPEPHWPLLLGRPAATALLTPMMAALLIRIHRRWLEEAE